VVLLFVELDSRTRRSFMSRRRTFVLCRNEGLVQRRLGCETTTTTTTTAVATTTTTNTATPLLLLLLLYYSYYYYYCRFFLLNCILFQGYWACCCCCCCYCCCCCCCCCFFLDIASHIVSPSFRFLWPKFKSPAKRWRQNEIPFCRK